MLRNRDGNVSLILIVVGLLAGGFFAMTSLSPKLSPSGEVFKGIFVNPQTTIKGNNLQLVAPNAATPTPTPIPIPTIPAAPTPTKFNPPPTLRPTVSPTNPVTPKPTIPIPTATIAPPPVN